MSPEAVVGPGLRQLPLLGWLVLVWILLWGTWSWANLISGVVVAVLATWLLQLPPVTEHARLRPLATLAFIGHFLVDLAVSSVQIAWQAVRPGGPVGSAVLAVRLRSDSDLVLTLVSLTLTLVPGSMVFDVDRERSILLLHVLPVRDEAEAERLRAGVLVIEERVVRAFGSAREIAALDRPVEQGPALSPGSEW